MEWSNIKNFHKAWHDLNNFNERLRECNKKKIIFLFLIQNICCGYSKEPFFWAPKTHVKNDGKENIYNLLFI